MPPGSMRLMLAIAVVIHHSFPLRLGGIAVSLFFALSGYWIAVMWREKYSSLQSPYLTFLISRWWRLAPVVLVSLLIAAGVGFARLVPIAGTHVLLDWKWWVTQPIIAGSSWFGRLLPPTWSLDAEMQFYIVAPLLIALVFRMGVSFAVFAMLFLLGWHSYLRYSGTSAESPRLDLHIVFFLFGIVFAKWHDHIGTVTTRALLIAALVCIAACVAVPETRPLFWLKGSSAHPEAASAIDLLPTLVSLLLAVPVLATTKVRSGKTDRLLGDLSFPLYMIHWIPRDWYYARVNWGNSAVHNSALLIINFSAAMLLALAILLLVDVPAQRGRVRWLRARARSESLQVTATEPPVLKCPAR